MVARQSFVFRIEAASLALLLVAAELWMRLRENRFAGLACAVGGGGSSAELRGFDFRRLLDEGACTDAFLSYSSSSSSSSVSSNNTISLWGDLRRRGESVLATRDDGTCSICCVDVHCTKHVAAFSSTRCAECCVFPTVTQTKGSEGGGVVVVVVVVVAEEDEEDFGFLSLSSSSGNAAELIFRFLVCRPTSK